jgi:exonuclease III
MNKIKPFLPWISQVNPCRKVITCLILLFVFMNSSYLEAQTSEVDLSLMQFNIWHEGTSVPNGMTYIRDVIQEANPDVVCFVEVRNYTGDWTTEIVNDLAAIGMNYNRGYVSGNDVSIISKYPITIEGPSLNSAVVMFEIDVYGTLVDIGASHLDYTYYACYLPRGYNCGGSPPYDGWDKIGDGDPEPVTDLAVIEAQNLGSDRDEQIADFINHVSGSSKPVIFMGDLNEPSHKDWTANQANMFDHNGVVFEWHTTKSLSDNGFTDAFREVYPDEVFNPGITWPAVATGTGSTSWTPESDERDRIDYIFYKGVDLTATSAAIVGPKAAYVNDVASTANSENDNFVADQLPWPSDHKGVIATISIPVDDDTTPPSPDPMTFATSPNAIGSTAISMVATTASDDNGVEYYFTCTAGGGNDSGWQDSTSYTDTGLTPETTYTYTVTACDKSVNQNTTAASTAEPATTGPEGDVDDVANGEIPVSGTVSGSYADTQTSNDAYESITEGESGGRPINRYSYLEHKWTINVTGGSTVTFFVEAYQSPSSDGDNFVFAYSTNDSTYTDMVTVTKTGDDNTYQTYGLPASTSGTVYIRVKDTDQTQGNRNRDTINIDHLFIRSAAGGPVCGDESCDPGEDQCNCPDDCGTPPSTETSCTDGIDNDCDTYTDCDDSDCDGDPACAEPYCGDGTCDPGEDQCNCPDDCGTPPSTETSCTDGIDNDCDTDVDCDDSDCFGDPACPYCGDGTCDPGEDQCNCPEDCGTPPSTETSCTDGIDNDCDTYTDCDDSDCDGDPACPDCLPKNAPCTDNADCCSGNCRPSGKCA